MQAIALKIPPPMIPSGGSYVPGATPRLETPPPRLGQMTPREPASPRVTLDFAASHSSRLGEYVLTKLIGEGGWAEVYLGRSLVSTREVGDSLNIYAHLRISGGGEADQEI